MRYFIEVAYRGGRYAGFQVQENANTVQAEVEKALLTFYKTPIELTGSSRTDAGVHAWQNFFHFDTEQELNPRQVYNLNALLPDDIAIKSIRPVAPDAHSRFDALSRRYQYFIYQEKDPFLHQQAFFFPYQLDVSLLNEAAAILMDYQDFTTFSKRNTQTHTKLCTLLHSNWTTQGNQLVYTVEANRFLRGMVKGLVGTMLRVGRGKMSINAFRQTIEAKDCSKADFSVAAHGLYLVQVSLPSGLPNPSKGRAIKT
jgi:tRNA pseudouridine38-40 synthase